MPSSVHCIMLSAISAVLIEINIKTKPTTGKVVEGNNLSVWLGHILSSSRYAALKPCNKSTLHLRVPRAKYITMDG